MILKKKGVWRGLSFVAVNLLALSVAGANVLESNVSMVDSTLNTISSTMVSDDDGSKWSAYVPDEEYLVRDAEGNITGGNLENIRKIHADMGQLIQEEGSVLLKNNVDADKGKGLPLKSDAKITLFGIASRQQLYVMGQGATVKAEQNVYLPEALKDAGFDVNPTMLDVYDQINRTPVQKPTRLEFDPKEASPSELAEKNATYKNSFANYNDAAIVVIYRPGAEANDFYTAEQGGVDTDATGARSPLGLTTNEREIIKLAKECSKNVIVLVNTGSAMEIDELEKDEDISSILWIGLTGNYGARGVARILNGEVNPSGHMQDIYAANTLSSPAMQNYGLFQFANVETVKEGKTTTYKINGETVRANSTDYLIEAEGIYTGYKYYETRYYDYVKDQYNARSAVGKFDSTGTNWNYSEEVTYGFGYGLSYTTFSQKVGNISVKNYKGYNTVLASLPVTVTNTGKVAGKSVVQVYASAPYTEGGVEKAAIQLAGFTKTDVIAPGKSVTVTVDMDLQNIASYDETANGGKGGYVLDPGKYYFAVGNGAHDALNNVLAKEGVTKTATNGMDYDGDAAQVAIYNVDNNLDNLTETLKVSKSGEEIKNKLQLANWNNYDGSETEVTYLSRSNWSGTWPKSYKDLNVPASMVNCLNGKLYEYSTTDDLSDILWDQDLGEEALTFADMLGVDYDDPKWETFLSQMSLDEAIKFAQLGGRTVNSIESVNFVGSTNFTENGPFGLYSYIDGALAADTDCPWAIPQQEGADRFYCTGFPNPVVVASTFNLELAHKEARMIGNDALFTPRYILWGPGMNTHRTPYSGRNVEYYSEDPVVTGLFGLEFAMGALEKGVIAAPKHLAFNDQDQNRKGIAPFLTEQRARENELRAFQIAFEAVSYNELGSTEKGMLGCMTSFSKLGALEMNIYADLLTGIVRNEWGFNGYIVSDMGDDTDIPAECWIAGMTGYDGSAPKNVDYEQYKGDIRFVSAVREVAHRNLWVYSQSHYMNAYNKTARLVQLETWWRTAYKAAIGVTASLCAVFTGLYVTGVVLNNKKKEEVA